MSPKSLPRIEVVHLFPELESRLLEVLDGLSGEDWQKPTVCPAWTVKDVAAHLLDGALRRLAMQRDGHFPPPPDGDLNDYADLVGFLNELNATWVEAVRRLSPRLIRELLEWSGGPFVRLLESLDPSAPALFPVAWAGEETSLNWFDVAREFTERWHHQQQIREAVGAPALTERRFLHPVLATFLRGLPHHYRNVVRPAGTKLEIEILGRAGGRWVLEREETGWRLSPNGSGKPKARLMLEEDLAWRLLTNGVDPDQAADSIRIEGDRELAEPFLSARSVMV